MGGIGLRETISLAVVVIVALAVVFAVLYGLVRVLRAPRNDRKSK